MTLEEIKQLVHIHTTPEEATNKAHAIAILTEWDEFKTYDWKSIYNSMMQPAFVFDGRNILDANSMKEIGFCYKAIGQ